ncbi:uncharacterized protein LOC133494600 [Syngnathoides biaculeatus]|uniref:uncharacterized protein LOC133494600 n=1 Tax=Syngnathoides biaculeatus TaxID=300417 RepID=UPI002ADD7010|nr:uncharacterized protein LOC133494600 [Syngnathoides biaculeatus]
MSRGEFCFQFVNMKLLNSLLLAWHCTLSRSDATEMRVSQSPDVEAPEGQLVVIHCCWPEYYQRVKVKWLKNSTAYRGDPRSPQNWRKDSEKCGSLEFANISRENSGTYVCQVNAEIPLLAEASGNGTVVSVTQRKSNGTAEGGGTRSPLWVTLVTSMASLTLLLVVALICNCKFKRTKGVKVIYESPRSDSDVGVTVKHRSSDSAQWCEVLVYESVDYFERADMKPSM